MSTPSASDNTCGGHYPDNPSSDESDFGDLDDFDIAITHDRNTKLKERHLVEKFFKEIREFKSLADDKKRSWLGDLPFYMCEDAIPLFVGGDDCRDDSEDYQLHPHYTMLEVDKTAAEPHNELCRLSIDGNTLEHPNLVIGIGRLFVNLANGKAERTSKWTGYEVFVDKELALRMVFDRHSIDPRATDWYPSPCRLSHPTLQDSGDEQRDVSSTSKERRFDIACFLPSLRDLANAESKKASEKVQEKIRRGEMRVCQVERSEIHELLETDSAPQEVSVDDPNQLCEAMLNAVGDDRMTAQKIIVLLDKYKDNFGMIREVITKELVKAAAGNQAYGEQIMTILLDQLKEKVRGSISEEVVKAAAGNWRYGAQIVEKLLKACGEVVCDNVSFAVICTAARNGQSGAPILELLLTANEEKVVKLISEVRSRAVKGEDCEKGLPETHGEARGDTIPIWSEPPSPVACRQSGAQPRSRTLRLRSD